MMQQDIMMKYVTAPPARATDVRMPTTSCLLIDDKERKAKDLADPAEKFNRRPLLSTF
jgi:hypothetical protein